MDKNKIAIFKAIPSKMDPTSGQIKILYKDQNGNIGNESASKQAVVFTPSERSRLFAYENKEELLADLSFEMHKYFKPKQKIKRVFVNTFKL